MRHLILCLCRVFSYILRLARKTIYVTTNHPTSSCEHSDLPVVHACMFLTLKALPLSVRMKTFSVVGDTQCDTEVPSHMHTRTINDSHLPKK